MAILSVFAIYSIQKFVRPFYKNIGVSIQRIVLSKKSVFLFVLVMSLNFFFAIGMGLSASGIFYDGDQLGIVVYDMGAIIFILGLAVIISKKWRDGKPSNK
jgi:hypothetical protein